MLKEILKFYKNNMLVLNIVLGVLIVLFLVFAFVFRKQLLKLYKKYEEIVNYIVVGASTTVVSIVSYFLLRLIIPSYIVNTILSWVIAVAYAYVTNRIFVFKSKSKKILKEIAEFVSCRLLTLLLEIVAMFLLVDLLSLHDGISKIVVQFIVLVCNYILSKLFVFRNKAED